MEYKMDKKEVSSRLQEVLNRNSDRKVNNLIPEDIRQLNICISALTIPVVVNTLPNECGLLKNINGCDKGSGCRYPNCVQAIAYNGLCMARC